MPILPTSGPIGAEPDSVAEPFDHAHERATPGEYEVTLRPGTAAAIGVTLATTARTGIGVFRFPATSQATFLIKVSEAQTGSQAAAVRIVGDREVEGLETSGHFCGSASDATLYFAAAFDQPFRSFGTWQGRTVEKGGRARAGVGSGAWVSFDATRHRTVTLKVAISYVSAANAWENLRAENAGWRLESVAAKARAAWNEVLGRIAVQGGTHDQQVQFYTALYHVLLHPNVFSDVNGDYMGFDFAPHRVAAGQELQYANFSGWDIYRSEVPLLALLAPHQVGDMVRSLLNDQAQGGWLPKWGYDNDYTGVMNGDAADPIIAEAYAFGARGFSTDTALKAMVKGATRTYEPEDWSGGYIERPHLREYERLGYVPRQRLRDARIRGGRLRDRPVRRSRRRHRGAREVPRQVAGLAEHLRQPRGVPRLRRVHRAPRRGRHLPPGSAFQIRPNAYGQRGFEEGNTIQYTWMVPQDFKGLIEAMGGNRVAVRRLDTLFDSLNVGPNGPYYWGRERAGFVHAVGVRLRWRAVEDPGGRPSPPHRGVCRDAGGEPGNDDLGAMSSWLVWSYLGMYPESPGAPVLVLGAPVFPRRRCTCPTDVTSPSRRRMPPRHRT